MNKTKLLFPTVALLSVSALAGCFGHSGTTEVAKDKTQIYIYNFGGGFGAEWFTDLFREFEELHKNDSLEDGKKGIQFILNNDTNKSQIMNNNNILNDKEDIYFTESAYYYTLKSKGVLADISDAVTSKIDGETKSIKDKMSDDQNAYWGIQEGGQVKYYGLPHYSGYTGLTYDVDLFDQQLFYLAKNPTGTTLDDKFVQSKTEERTLGPDMKTGIIDGIDYSIDDGLPATFEQFYDLCEYIKSYGMTPLITNGKNKEYMNFLIQSVAANNVGYDQMKLNYTVNGQATTLGRVVDGEFVKDPNPTTINGKTNGKELARSAGKYYGTSFLETVYRKGYLNSEYAENDSYTHVDTQEKFLRSVIDGNRVAMINEGIWWENEANDIFGRMPSEYSKENRRLGFMQLPTAEVSDGQNVLVDHLNSICFMKANVPEYKQAICKEFIKFIHKDSSLIHFSTVTNTPKAFIYVVPETEKAKMTYFGRSVLTLKERSQVLYPTAQSSIFVNNQTFFKTESQFATTVSGKDYNRVFLAMFDAKASTETIFNGYYEYFSKTYPNLND